jgi:signal transduction histidine kinase/CheY-like chemotaxis protein
MVRKGHDRFECRLRAKDGALKDVVVSAASLCIGVEKVAYLSLRDVTAVKRGEEERRLLQAKLHQSERLESMGLLVGGVAHDFNNLLVGVLGNAELLLIELPDDSPASAYAGAIKSAASHLSELTRQLLACGGNGSVDLRPVDLSALVEEMTPLLRMSCGRQTALKSHLTDGLPVIAGDVCQLRQLLLNLVANAGAATKDASAPVHVRTGARHMTRAELSSALLGHELHEGEFVYLEVSDRGTGMDSETVARVFDPFFTTRKLGRGLGLSAVLGVVRRHRGAIAVRTRLGHGTTFTVFIPVPTTIQRKRIAVKPQETTGAASSPTASNNGVALLVDDEAPVRRVCKSMLECLGFEVITANSGEEAVAVASRRVQSLGLVILDLTMPGMDGVQTLQRLREIRADLPVIISSGLDRLNVQERFGGGHSGAAFMRKPYTFSDLREKVAQVQGL